MALYEFTDLAGDWVAGRRRPAGAKTIELTETEAAYELREGTIVPVTTDKPAKAKG